MENKRAIIIVISAIIIIVSIGLLEMRKVDISTENIDSDITLDKVFPEDISKEERVRSKSSKYEVAKEITTPDGFINIDEITIKEFIGKKVILVDFWTYSCVNCQRTLPYLNSWQEKYSDKGLVILGVHTPEFEFEKKYDNVVKAVEKFNVEYPVVLDNDYSTWRAYKNRYWPRKYIIDIDGFIVYDHIGEGAYNETEKKIVELLNERSKVIGENKINIIDNDPKGIQEVDFSKIRTPEIYLGHSRLEYIANLPKLGCLDKKCEFVAPDVIPQNSFALDGSWNIGGEMATSLGNDGFIVTSFSASKVNIVLGVQDVGNDIKLEIYLDGKLISEEDSGSDVESGVVTVRDHALYNVVDLDGKYGEHVLKIKILDPGLEAFAFTFG